MRHLALAFVLALTACQHDQTFAESMVLVCSVPERAPNLPPGERLVAGFEQIRDQVTNPEARKLLASFGEVDDKRELLAAAVREAGLTRCALADAWSVPTR